MAAPTKVSRIGKKRSYVDIPDGAREEKDLNRAINLHNARNNKLDLTIEKAD